MNTTNLVAINRKSINILNIIVVKHYKFGICSLILNSNFERLEIA